MYRITKPISWFVIIATLITPTFSSTSKNYTYKDVGLSQKLKIYNITIDENKIVSSHDDILCLKEFLEESKSKRYSSWHIKHPLFIIGYIRKLGITNVPKEIRELINGHIPIDNIYIEPPTYFFLPEPITKHIQSFFNSFKKPEKSPHPYDIYDDESEDEQPIISQKGYLKYCTLKDFFTEYDDEKKDYKKRFDTVFRQDAMKRYNEEERKRLKQRDVTKQAIVIEFIGLNELSKNKTNLLKFCKYSSSFKDIIDIINHANGFNKVNTSLEIEEYYSKEDLKALKNIPKSFNKNWSKMPDDIYFYSKQNGEYKLLDPNKPIAHKSNEIKIIGGDSKYHASSKIYFSTTPLTENLFGISN